jgi:hypothetical protein
MIAENLVAAGRWASMCEWGSKIGQRAISSNNSRAIGSGIGVVAMIKGHSVRR